MDIRQNDLSYSYIVFNPMLFPLNLFKDRQGVSVCVWAQLRTLNNSNASNTTIHPCIMSWECLYISNL